MKDWGITAQMHPAIGGLTRLEFLDLSNNNLEGELNFFISNPYISKIDISNNNLYGDLDIFGQNPFENCSYIRASGNVIRGSIPSSFLKCSLVDLSRNQLSGLIPSGPEPSAVTRLYLDHNKLDGEIPAQLTDLIELDCSDNRLTGIPDTFFQNNKGLIKLNLSGNQLSGALSTNVKYLVNAEVINFSHNSFTSNLPREIAVPKLTNIDVSNNHFSGEFPSELDTLETLDFCNAKHNDFSCPYAVTKSACVKDKCSNKEWRVIVYSVIGSVVVVLGVVGIFICMIKGRKGSTKDEAKYLLDDQKPEEPRESGENVHNA